MLQPQKEPTEPRFDVSALRPPSSTEKFLGFSPTHGVCRSRTWWGAAAGSQQDSLTAAASASPRSIPPAVNLALSKTAGPLLSWKRPRAARFQSGHLVSLLFRWDFPCLPRRGLAPARCTHTRLAALRIPVPAEGSGCRTALPRFALLFHHGVLPIQSRALSTVV